MNWWMLLVWMAPLLLAAGVIHYLIHSVIRGEREKPGSSELGSLETRYARGEIDREAP